MSSLGTPEKSEESHFNIHLAPAKELKLPEMERDPYTSIKILNDSVAIFHSAHCHECEASTSSSFSIIKDL